MTMHKTQHELNYLTNGESKIFRKHAKVQGEMITLTYTSHHCSDSIFSLCIL